MRGEEPQSYRDLALVYAQDGRDQEAVDLLYQLIEKPWDARFPQIALIAVGEMNAIIANSKERLNLQSIDQRLLKNLPVDIRVVLTWDADNSDMDLWVIDPYGEKCFYGQPNTRIGGHMSNDFTGGYGPEEFMLKQAIPGSYQIKVNYYGNNQQIIAGATTIQVALFLDFGKKTQRRKDITLRLKDKKEVIDVGNFDFETQDQ
jgi:uncharacterized protein YfaP (DUF2135 family)